MKVLFLAAEVGPYLSVGGLSQVSYFLPRALSELNNDVRVFTPKFGTMDSTAPTKSGWRLKNELLGLRVPVSDEIRGETDLICNVKSYQRSGSKVKTYFLENREYYELRANVYGYKDDHIRFALMCKGCLEWLLVQKSRKTQNEETWFPEIIHCNDWHAAYFIELARTVPRYRELLKRTPIVLTVHNFTFQGNFDFKYCAPTERDDGKKQLLPLLDPEMQKQNPLLRGILYADAITTVSPTHAREVLTEEYGEGLDKLLLRERNKVSGILNGLDVREFDPTKDPLVYANFTRRNFQRARRKNKRYLQDQFGLPKDERAFLLAYSGRLTNQKGLTLLIEAMEHLLPEFPWLQFVVLGGGDDSYRRQLTELASAYPKQVGLHLLPNFQLPRKIFSGADGVLIPSLFEPGGIVALEALRYGAVPIVRRTGGLNDIIEDFDPATRKGNGFSFINKDAWSLYGAVVSAATTYRNSHLWERLVLNALASDFSWEHAAHEYYEWYRRTLATYRRMASHVPHVAYTGRVR